MNERRSESSWVFFFSVLFASFYFLFLLLTESFYLLWFMPVLIPIYLATVYYTLKRDRQAVTPREIWSVSIVSGISLVLLCLTVVSPSLSLSLNHWIGLAIGLLSFSVFLVLPFFDKAQVQSFYAGIAFVNVVFIGMTLFFLVFKDLARFLPLSNLVNFIQGQNHAYILYLYVLPLTLYFGLKSKKPTLWFVLSGVFVLGVVLSFSRFGLFLLVFEILALFQWLKTPWTKFSKKILLVCVGVLVAYGAGFFLFSLFPQLSFGENCKLPVFQNQLCKNFFADGRLEYWRQATKGIEEHPLLGNGGGTFSLASLKYRQTQTAYSVAPHNEYLQLIFEYGVVGLVVVVAYFVCIGWAFSRWKHLSELTRIMLLTVLVGSLDALLNFNWSFSGVFLLECAWLAITLRRVRQETTTRVQSAAAKPEWVLVALGVAALPLLWLSARFLTAEVRFGNNSERYLQTFPYISWRARTVFEDKTTSEQTKAQIQKLYANDPDFYLLMLKRQIDPQKQVDTYEHYLKLNPLDEEMHAQYMLAATQTDNPGVVIAQEQWLLAFYKSDTGYMIQDIEPYYLETLINYANQVSKKDVDAARKITALAYSFQPWRVNEVRSVFFTQPEKFKPDHVIYLLSVVKPGVLWSSVQPIDTWTMNNLVTAIEAEDWPQKQLYLTLLLQHSDWEHWAVWQTMAGIFRRKIDTLPKNDPASTEHKKALISAWRDGLATLKKFDTVGDTTNDEEKWSQEIESFAH